MMMFGLFCLVKIFRSPLRKALLCRRRLLPEAKEDIKVLWSELDLNLLGEILGRLTSPADQVRFRAVCKAWLDVDPVGNTTLLPWFVSYDRQLLILTGNLELSLYEQSSTIEPTSVHTISLTELGIPTPRSCIDTRATCINNWLFFSTRVAILGPPRYRRNFILFSPFTKQVIKLPQSDYPLPFTFNRVFSTDPKSPDCVFLLSDTYNESRKIAILTYRNGDKEWTARQFDIVDGFYPFRCFPIYFKGIFYLVSQIGQIASYNILNEELKFENLGVDIQFCQYTTSHMQYEVFELNGDLMLGYFGSYRNAGNPYIKRFDWSSKLWMPVCSLAAHSLFVARRLSAVPTINIRDHGILRNKKIYHVNSKNILIRISYPDSTNHCIAIRGHGFLWLDSLLGYGHDLYNVYLFCAREGES